MLGIRLGLRLGFGCFLVSGLKGSKSRGVGLGCRVAGFEEFKG